MSILLKYPFTKKYQTLFNNNGINTVLRISHFLGQANHESPGLLPKRENLNYSTEGLLKTFGRHRISYNDAMRYGRTPSRAANQQMIANCLYGGAWGRTNLGNIEYNDGWLYRGGGVFQLTGRSNYTRLSNDTGIDFVNKPERISNEVDSLIAAIWYWNKRGLNKYADQDNVDAVSDLINLGKLTPKFGDSIGFRDRNEQVKKFKRIFQ